MSRSRSIYFHRYDDILMNVELGTFTMALYHAAQLDSVKGEKLINTTIPEVLYRLGVDFEGDAGGLSSEDFEAHFVPSEIQEVILFIENDLIPVFNNENKNLIDHYGGVSNFVDLWFNSQRYLLHYGIGEEEFFEEDNTRGLALWMGEYKKLLQASLDLNRPFEVWVR